MTITRSMIGIAGLAVLAFSSASAQDAAPVPAADNATGISHPWAAFFGCWRPVDGTPSTTCVAPVEGSPFGVEQVQLVAGSVQRVLSLDASGQRRELNQDGCVGWESAEFSRDAARVYTRGRLVCGNGPEQGTSGVLSITPSGDFLQIAAVIVGEQRTLTAQRMARVSWEQVPAVMQARLAPLRLMAQGARTLAARPLDFDAVEDAVQSADAYVVEAWMAETGRDAYEMRATRRELQRLVALNASTRVIDMTVMLSNPEHFERPQLERVMPSFGGGTPVNLRNDANLFAFCARMMGGPLTWRGGLGAWSPMMDPTMRLGFYSMFPECIGAGFDARFAYTQLGFGSWYGGPFGGNGALPVRVTGTPSTPTGPGTVTKGNGYTSGRPSTDGTDTARPRSEPASATARGSAPAAATSRGVEGSSGVRSAGSNGTGRTAKERNP